MGNSDAKALQQKCICDTLALPYSSVSKKEKMDQQYLKIYRYYGINISITSLTVLKRRSVWKKKTHYSISIFTFAANAFSFSHTFQLYIGNAPSVATALVVGTKTASLSCPCPPSEADLSPGFLWALSWTGLETSAWNCTEFFPCLWQP